MNNLIDKKHKLGQRIFEHYEYGEGFGKKKNMHWATFKRLFAQYEKLEQKWTQELDKHLNDSQRQFKVNS